jgi:hypothetical protein
MANLTSGYSIYLMIELAKACELLPKEYEYDLCWNDGNRLYNEFEGSSFDDEDKSEYDAINDFLEKKLECKVFEERSKAVVVHKVEIDVTGMTYTVTGDGFPTQTLSFDNYSDWDSIKDENGESIVDCQIDFDENFQFQWVNYRMDLDGKISNGLDYQSCDDAQMEIVNCAGFRLVKNGEDDSIAKFSSIKEAQKVILEMSGNIHIEPIPELVGGEMIDPDDISHFEVVVDFGDEVGTQTVANYDDLEEATAMVARIKNKDLNEKQLEVVEAEWQGTLDDVEKVFVDIIKKEKPVPSELSKRFMEIFYVKYGSDGEFEDDETVEELNRFFKNIR